MNLIQIFLEQLGNLLGVKRKSHNTLTIEVTLKSGTSQYYLNEYQRLNCTKLRRITVPYSEALTKSPTNKTLANEAGYVSSYLTLTNVKSEKIRDTEPLLNYRRDDTYFPDKGRFDEDEIDWTKSFIVFPDNTPVAANDGKSILIVVEYQDIDK